MKWQRKLMMTLVLGGALANGAVSARADDTRPATGNDDWFRGGNGAAVPTPNATQPPTATDPRRRDDQVFARAGAYPQDFPQIEVHDWLSASANAAAARAFFRRAENDVAAAIRRAEHNFERSKDLQKALAAERDAYADYLLARQKALQTVLENPRYQQIMGLRDDMARKLAQGRASHDLSHDEILAMATLKLNYASDARAMEIAALNADPSLKDARDRMVAASARVSEMRSNFDDSLRDDTQIADARRHLEDARINLITAQAYLSATSVAGGSAMDYAYYLHGSTQPRVYDPYGYGAGPYSPFWVRN